MVLVPADQLAERRAEHPELTVQPLKFGSRELRAEHWRFLMGAVGNQSTYIRQLQRIMKANRRDLRIDVIRSGVEDSGMPDHLKQLAQERLNLAEEYIDDSVSIKDIVRPGRMIIIDLRDEFIEKDEALGLFVVLMQLFAEAQGNGGRFNKLVVFDEAHKYIESPDLGGRPGIQRAGDAAQGHERARRQPGSAVGADQADRTVRRGRPAQVQLARVAAPHAEGDRLPCGLVTGEDGESCAR